MSLMSREVIGGLPTCRMVSYSGKPLLGPYEWCRSKDRFRLHEFLAGPGGRCFKTYTWEYCCIQSGLPVTRCTRVFPVGGCVR